MCTSAHKFAREERSFFAFFYLLCYPLWWWVMVFDVVVDDDDDDDEIRLETQVEHVSKYASVYELTKMIHQLS